MKSPRSSPRPPRKSLDEVFPWDDAETAEFVNRVRCLAQWMPELELPAFDAAGLQAVLPQRLPWLPLAGRICARPPGWRTCKPR